MKKIKILSKTGLMCLWVLLLVYETTQAQSPYTGMWEGNFMEQFKTVILLDQTDDSGYAGKIIMYAGENRIQDDELSKIIIENRTLSFYIASKESSFKGTFNESDTELSGNFIFPDNTKHSLTVRKYEKDSTAVEATAPSLKESLKLSFPAEELKSEFRELINKLKKYHPRLYSYTSEDTFNREVSQILGKLNKEMTLEEYYLKIAPLVASVKCSHTGIRLPAAYQIYLEESGKYFPLKVFVRDKRVFCLSTSGNPGEGVDPGSEILVINHRPVSQIIEELLSVIPSEGNCMTTKYQELNRNFHTYFHMMDPAESFLIEFSSSGSRESLQMEACPYEQVQQSEHTQLPMQTYDFHMERNLEYGVLKVASFNIRNMEAYFALLDSTFQMLEKDEIPYLVVDLRDNSGGHPIFAAQLFSYLTDHEFTYFQRNPEVEDFEPLYNPMQANPHAYSGEVFVLVNGACLSTTGHLISLLKYHTDAVFIGEAPGSTFSCNDFSIQLTLPVTGIEMNIPRTTFITNVTGFKEGETFPLDYHVQQTVQDQIKGVDRYMHIVYTIIGENRTNP